MELPLTGCSVDLTRRVVRSSEGRERVLAPREAALLRYLVERAGQDVSREDLAVALWGEAASVRRVDVVVRRLRARLEEPHPPRHVLTAHGSGYRFAPLPERTALVPPADEAVIALATGELRLASRCFVRDGRSWPLSALDARILELLVGSLGRPVAREGLIRKVWGRGSHDGSLDAALSRLRTKLERDPAHPVALVTCRGEGPMLLAAGRRGSAPTVTSSFVDRPELELARAASSAPGLVTLHGPAGIGKTRLALELARGPSERWFCDLTRTTTTAGLVRKVATTLGAEPTEDPDQVGRMLRGRPPGTLLVLDNFEQLVDGSPVVEAWVRAAPGLHVLATSRIPLGVRGERVLPLEPLDGDRGAELFRSRASSPDADPRLVEELVRRLDGLPLAIELAAGLTGRLPVDAILERLNERLDLLVSRPEGATSHHSTLRAALDWSWHLLDDGQREVLASLSVFWSPVDRDGAAAVVGRRVDSELEELDRRSLLVRDELGWRLLESVREYAREKLRVLELRSGACERHADLVLARLEPLARDLRGPRGTEAVDGLNRLRADLIAALDATGRAGVRGRLARVLAHRGFSSFDETLKAVLEEVLERGATPSDAPWLRMRLAEIAYQAGGYEVAERELAHAEADAADAETRLEIALCHGWMAGVRDDAAEIERWIGRIGGHLAELPPSAARLRGQGELALLEVRVHQCRSELEPWAAAARRGLPCAEALGDVHLLGDIYRELAGYHHATGELETALDISERAVALARRCRRPHDEKQALYRRANIDYDRGAFQRVEATVLELEALGRTIGNPFEERRAALRSFCALDRLDLEAVDEALKTRQMATLSSVWDRTESFVLRLRGRPVEALAILERAAGSLTEGLKAGASAEAGRIADARRELREARRKIDPLWWGGARELDLTEALIEVEAARGTSDEARARSTARAVLDAGALTRCDDGVWRERPGDVELARILLGRALLLERTG